MHNARAQAQAHIVVLHWQIGAPTLMQQQQQQIMLLKRLFTIDFLVKHAHYTRSEFAVHLSRRLHECNMQILLWLRLQRQQLAYFLFCFVNAVAAVVVIIIIIFG